MINENILSEIIAANLTAAKQFLSSVNEIDRWPDENLEEHAEKIVSRAFSILQDLLDFYKLRTGLELSYSAMLRHITYSEIGAILEYDRIEQFAEVFDPDDFEIDEIRELINTLRSAVNASIRVLD